MKRLAIACVCLALPDPSPAQYQMVSPMLYEGPRIALQDHADRYNQGTDLGSAIGDRIIGHLTTAPAVSPLPGTGVVLDFDVSPTRRRANLAQFVEKSRAVDPAGAEQMAALFASTDPIVAVGKELVRYGLRTDNAADAYAVYWVQAWQAANGDTSDPSRATMQAVKAQAANALAATPAFASATDATKQEFSEALLVQAMMISATVDTYKADPAMMAKLGDAVRKGAKATGLDLDAMTLTKEGFRPARKTGAANPAPGAPRDTQRAEASPAADPPYLMLAAAGGAGLGGAILLGKLMARRG